MAQPQIFVSHSHQDNDYCRVFVMALRTELGSENAVWYDEHNLGWGKLRREIERELAQRQHFVAILSPTAVASDWVNDEIDAAIELLRRGSMHSIQFVVALRCDMPLLLANYKRVVGPDGQPFSPQEAAKRALAVIYPLYTSGSQVPASDKQSPKASEVQPPIPPDRFPQRLADLGFTAHSDKGIAYILPPLCTVPAGPFLMGSDPNRDPAVTKMTWAEFDNQMRKKGEMILDKTLLEKPQHSVTLPAYDIDRFSVTVAEYACFVGAGQPIPKDWQTQLGRFDHPVVNVSWYGAVAYATWLSECTGERWRLATQAEWEKAARGTDGRIYPWGNTFEKARCNTKESGIETTTPIGNYPSGASPYGVQDMAGNVWDWTSSRRLPFPYKISDEREDPTSTYGRIKHGGAYCFTAGSARAAKQYEHSPDTCGSDSGFRLVRAVRNS